MPIVRRKPAGVKQPARSRCDIGVGGDFLAAQGIPYLAPSEAIRDEYWRFEIVNLFPRFECRRIDLTHFG